MTVNSSVPIWRDFGSTRIPIRVTIPSDAFGPDALNRSPTRPLKKNISKKSISKTLFLNVNIPVVARSSPLFSRENVTSIDTFIIMRINIENDFRSINLVNSTTHSVKRARHKATPAVTTKFQGRRGRPHGKRRLAVLESSSSSSEESEEESDSSDEEFEDENQIEVKDIIKSREVETLNDNNSKNEPLDLSKTALDLTKGQKIEKTVENKTPAKRGRKRIKSLEKKPIQKTVFRCDYPGCRKTFLELELLHQHEKGDHKNLSSDCRSRYERRCKGNLYYKI